MIIKEERKSKPILASAHEPIGGHDAVCGDVIISSLPYKSFLVSLVQAARLINCLPVLNIGSSRPIMK